MFRRRSLLSTNGSISTFAEHADFIPYISIALGSDRQQIDTVLLDTGSSPLWVPSSNCSVGCWSCEYDMVLYPNVYCLYPNDTVALNSCDLLTNEDIYPAKYADNCTDLNQGFNPVTSVTYASDPILGPFLIQYGDGSTFIGEFVRDTLMLETQTFTNFTFSMVTMESYNNGPSYGILGFAPPEYKDDGSILVSMLNDDTISTKQFSLYYPTELEGTGQLIIGNCCYINVTMYMM